MLPKTAFHNCLIVHAVVNLAPTAKVALLPVELYDRAARRSVKATLTVDILQSRTAQHTYEILAALTPRRTVYGHQVAVTLDHTTPFEGPAPDCYVNAQNAPSLTYTGWRLHLTVSRELSMSALFRDPARSLERMKLFRSTAASYSEVGTACPQCSGAGTVFVRRPCRQPPVPATERKLQPPARPRPVIEIVSDDDSDWEDAPVVQASARKQEAPPIPVVRASKAEALPQASASSKDLPQPIPVLLSRRVVRAPPPGLESSAAALPRSPPREPAAAALPKSTPREPSPEALPRSPPAARPTTHKTPPPAARKIPQAPRKTIAKRRNPLKCNLKTAVPPSGPVRRRRQRDFLTYNS